MSNDWLKTLRSKMENYEETAPQGLLDDVMGRLEVLDQEYAPISIEEEKVPDKVRGKGIVVALLLGAAAVGLVLLTNTSVNQVNQGMKINAPMADFHEHETPTKQYISETNQDLVAQVKKAVKSILPPVVRRLETDNSGGMIAQVLNQDSTVVSPDQQVLPSKKTEEKPITEKKQNKTSSTRSRDNGLLALVHNQKKTHEGLKFGLSLGGLPKSANLSNSDYAALAVSNDYEMLPEKTTYIIPVGQNEVKKKVHHHQPVTVGVTLSIPLMHRLSLETGLMYSYHSSDMANVVGSTSYSSKQQLHFVGIPLEMNYSLWQNNKLNVYVAAGGRAEKLVSGRQENGEDSNGKSTYSKVKMERLQWSLSSRMGVEYKLSHKLGLYVEPGAAYHFDNKSDVQTIYNDRPITFELKAGIRFNTK